MEHLIQYSRGNKNLLKNLQLVLADFDELFYKIGATEQLEEVLVVSDHDELEVLLFGTGTDDPTIRHKHLTSLKVVIVRPKLKK